MKFTCNIFLKEKKAIYCFYHCFKDSYKYKTNMGEKIPFYMYKMLK